MELAFYIAALVAVVTTALAVTRANAIHALLYLILSLFSVALIFLILGAPLVAALEIIIYAGAVMVLFVFVVMLLNLGQAAEGQERRLLRAQTWIGPGLICLLLLAELLYVVTGYGGTSIEQAVDVKAVSQALFGPYVLAVELAGFLLLAGMVGAYHLARPEQGVGRR